MLEKTIEWRNALLDEYGKDAALVLEIIDDCVEDRANIDDICKDVDEFLTHSNRIATDLRSFGSNPKALELLIVLARCSRYGFEVVLRRPHVYWSIVENQTYKMVYERSEMATFMQNALGTVEDRDKRIDQLIYTYQEQFVRITLGDLSGDLIFESVTREISDLAEVVVKEALALSFEKFDERYGQATTPFCVIAFGKFGGRELNYSSDLDLMFMFGKNGKTTGGNDSFDHNSYFLRVGKELIRILDERHEAGRLFRIDMRLRPEGASGALCLNYQQTVDYYYSVGRSWERQAMIKARIVAGDEELGQRLLKELQPWVYPQYQSIEALSTAREMRQRIEERAEVDNVKTGAGGIRDIEFLVQFFQLTYGGRYPNLRGPATLPVLEELGNLSLIESAEVTSLHDDYVWLRMVEHRLQMWEARQLHDVPDDEYKRFWFARRCGYTGDSALEDFEAKLVATRERVRELAERYYLSTNTLEDQLRFILNEKTNSRVDIIEQIFKDIDFRNINDALDILRDLRREPFFILSRARVDLSFFQLLPQILQHLRTSPDPDQTLKNFQRLVGVVGSRRHFYEELVERPGFLALVMGFAGWADYPLGLFERFPSLIDDVLESGTRPVVWDDNFLKRARVFLGTDGVYLENLSYFHAREIIRIVLRHLRGEELHLVEYDLSMLSRCVLQLVLEICDNELDEQLGRPVDEGGKELRFSVLGLGKFGGFEMSYASDMDVIFVADTKGNCTKRQNRDGKFYFNRLAQNVMGVLERQGLYPIDPRLRPWGDQGPLVSSLKALEDYWTQNREIWERLAMTRVSVVAGCEELGQDAVKVIYRHAVEAAPPENAAEQVRTMRYRLEESVDGRDHIKRGFGGYVDVEFLTEFLSLGHSKDELPGGEPIPVTLTRLGKLGFLSKELLDNCTQGLSFLRRMEAHMRLNAGDAISSIPTEATERQKIARQIGYRTADEMDLELHLVRERCREAFEEIVQ